MKIPNNINIFPTIFFIFHPIKDISRKYYVTQSRLIYLEVVVSRCYL